MIIYKQEEAVMSKTEYLLSMLMQLPPSLDDIEKELQVTEYTAEEVTLAACKFADNCFLECRDFEEEFKRKPSKEEVHSSYIYEICKLLLKYGLNPNLIIDDTNIMYELRYVDYEYIAAETLKLMLENNGKVDIDDGDEPLFLSLDFDIVFDVIELKNKELFDKEFKFWILMIGYGATIKDNKCPINVVNGYSIEEFKDFKNFTYEIEFLEEDWTMHIIDIRTNKEVATL